MRGAKENILHDLIDRVRDCTLMGHPYDIDDLIKETLDEFESVETQSQDSQPNEQQDLTQPHQRSNT